MKTKKLKCIITGKILFATNDYYTRKLEKLGGNSDTLHQSYVCKEAKNLLKQGYTVDKIREMLNIDDESLGVVEDTIISNIINQGRSYIRGITNEQVPGLVNNVVHKTDPEVKKFIETITSH
jgi:hypothetical protein